MKGVLKLRESLNDNNKYETDLKKYNGTQVKVLKEHMNSYEIETFDTSEYTIFKDELINKVL